MELNLPSIHSFLDNKVNSIILRVLLDCNVFYTSDSVHRWLVLALFGRNMMMNVHRLVRILKERSGTTLVCKSMHVYIHANNFVILLQHILCKAFLILKITFIFSFYGVRGAARQGYHFLRSLRCRVEVTEINVRRLDIKACIFFYHDWSSSHCSSW